MQRTRDLAIRILLGLEPLLREREVLQDSFQTTTLLTVHIEHSLLTHHVYLLRARVVLKELRQGILFFQEFMLDSDQLRIRSEGRL